MVFTPRVGVYICHCGINIAATVDVAAVAKFAVGLPGVVVARHYTYMCSDPGQVLIKNDIAELNLNRVVVASCSPLMHEPTFRATVADAGLNPYCYEMANIREQCSWVHPGGPNTTLKAMQLVASAVAKATHLEPLEVRQVPVTPAALVIGGGFAGLQASLDIAEAGFQVTLVERSSQLGGHAAQLYRTFPTLESVVDLLNPVICQVKEHPRIAAMTEAEVIEVGGYVGNFKVKVRRGEEVAELLVGAILVATGYEVFDARRKPELGYGVYPQVITTLDFERLAAEGIQVNGRQPKRVVFIQCVGSRDQSLGNPYCSRVCCMVTAKQARLVRQTLPESEVSVFYIDVRAFGKNFEEFYDLTREEGVIYRRGNPSEIIKRGERVVVRAEDTLLGEPVEVEADLVVLAVGMTPRADTGAVAGLLKLARSADGFFLEAHPKLRPVDTAMAGLFLAGCCQGPKDISETISQARAAASAALIPLMRGQVPVEAATSYVDEELCAGCGQCAQICAFSALALHPLRGVMTVNPVLCQGCGACAAACPSGAINVHHFTFEQFIAQIDALVDGEFLPMPVSISEDVIVKV
ncbi:MAG TPA: CoB--CoM heterodisulfide reductase iron-sulfur subunit A family protein [Anaerolineales bacterium]|nr:CoB--CoM heterodisulfide reductase iron-sulfur subunit A family protein [Anaerolineales bacterium]